MALDADRYERQRRLREVGEQGQRRIEESEARLGAGPGAGVALAYLARAGVTRASIGQVPASAFQHAAWFRFTGPAAVAHGAECALTHLLSALGAE